MTDKAIIHTFAVAAAGVGAGLAKVPAPDSTVLVPLQAAMLVALAHRRHQHLTNIEAMTLVMTLGATMAGRTIARGIRFVPVVGEVANAATAAALTEAVGWAAVRWLEEPRDSASARA